MPVIVSVIESIKASIVQGSGIGPTAYDIGTSDLHVHVIEQANRIVKFAVDIYLISAHAKKYPR